MPSARTRMTTAKPSTIQALRLGERLVPIAVSATAYIAFVEIGLTALPTDAAGALKPLES